MQRGELFPRPVRPDTRERMPEILLPHEPSPCDAEEHVSVHVPADETEIDPRWLAMELHDGPIQDATAAWMELEAVLADETLPQGHLRERVRRAAKSIRAAVEGARRLVAGLREPVLDALGLVGAVEHLAAQSSGMPLIEVVVEGRCEKIHPLVEAEAYRIIQEAVHNLRRHSHSDRAVVRLGCDRGRLCLEIRDWGVGFDPSSVASNRFGLAGIRERTRRLQGHAAVESGPGQGTRIRVELPLSPPQRFAETLP